MYVRRSSTCRAKIDQTIKLWDAQTGQERAALKGHLSSALRRAAPPWLIDVVLAYTTVAAFFDPDRIGYVAVAEFVSGLSVSAERDGPGAQPGRPRHARPGDDLQRRHFICYEHKPATLRR
jgi:hypothetical protein